MLTDVGNFVLDGGDNDLDQTQIPQITNFEPTHWTTRMYTKYASGNGQCHNLLHSY
jgi:hypothetical protein